MIKIDREYKGITKLNTWLTYYGNYLDWKIKPCTYYISNNVKNKLINPFYLRYIDLMSQFWNHIDYKNVILLSKTLHICFFIKKYEEYVMYSKILPKINKLLELNGFEFSCGRGFSNDYNVIVDTIDSITSLNSYKNKEHTMFFSIALRPHYIYNSNKNYSYYKYKYEKLSQLKVFLDENFFYIDANNIAEIRNIILNYKLEQKASLYKKLYTNIKYNIEKNNYNKNKRINNKNKYNLKYELDLKYL